jgi:hypothetical protein
VSEPIVAIAIGVHLGMGIRVSTATTDPGREKDSWNEILLNG